MFDFGEADFGSRPPPARYEFTCNSPPKQKPKKASVKVRSRDKRRQAAVDLAELDSAEAQALEAQLGMAPRELPPHLRAYALQRRNAACFSGPGILPGEQEMGHVEYKLRLLDPTPSRFQQLVTQLNWRLSEGAGQCLYAVGVEDNGHPRGLDGGDLRGSLEVLEAMAAEVGAEAEVLQTPAGSGEGRRCAVVRVVRAAAPALNYVDLRVAVAGGVDSGKSTLVGVLSHGAGGAPLLDNGRGAARMRVFRHKHECESGHTSSISLQQCCYDAGGAVLNYSGLSSLTPAEAAASAARMLRFFDLGGHERFSKTLLHGLTAMLPDHVLLCVSAVAGVSWATREHLAVSLALGIPLLVAITKADQASEAAVEAVAGDVRCLLAAAVRQGGGSVGSAASLAPLVQTEAQAVQLAAAVHCSRIVAPGASLCVPLFPISAVTGASLQLLHAFFCALPPTGAAGTAGKAAGTAAGAGGGEGMQGWGGGPLQQQQAAPTGAPAAAAAAAPAEGDGGGTGPSQPAHFQIDGCFEVADVGTVYSGTVVCGSLRIGQQLLLGPLDGGAFRSVIVTGIHRSKVDVGAAHRGQHATVAVQPLGGGGEEAAGEEEGVAAAPVRADSAGCLHAWMQQAGGSPAVAIGPQAGAAPGPGAACGAARGPSSSLTAQLAACQARQALPAAAAAGSAPGGDHLHRLWGSSPQLAPGGGGPAPRPRKGAVLLDPSLAPCACTQFEAVLVLLGGHWPARGLLSGCYPPEGDESEEADPALVPRGGSFDPSLATAAGDGGGGLGGGSLGAARPHSLGSGKLHRAASRRRLASYTPVVHCGSIRQAAHVVAMRELPLHAAGGGGGGGGARQEPWGDGEAAAGWVREDSCGVDELLSALDLLSELSGGSEQPGSQPDPRQLAGAVAAAGVLLPHALPAAGASPSASTSASASASVPSTSAAGTSPASAAGSSGAGSGEGTPVTPAAPAGGGGGPGLQLAAALERQRSLLQPGDDIGCLAVVTFAFMHQPEWLVEGARLVVRDRTSGRAAGAGYVTAVHLSARQGAGS